MLEFSSQLIGMRATNSEIVRDGARLSTVAIDGALENNFSQLLLPTAKLTH